MLPDNEVVQLIDIILLMREMGLEQFANLNNGVTDGITLTFFFDPLGDQINNPLPLPRIDTGIDSGISQHPDLAFENGNKDEDAVCILGLVELFGKKTGKRRFLYLGLDLTPGQE